MADIQRELLARIGDLAAEKPRVLIAIDGSCGAGKTTFAAELESEFDCNIFHMDDFFLRPEQRTKSRLSQPGGNVDCERFLDQVLKPVACGSAVEYRRYNCKTQTIFPPVTVEPKKINIIEGSYCLHPALRDYYDIRIFMSVSPEEQMKRIESRNGKEQAEVFGSKWIVLENLYFDAFHVKESCDYCISTNNRREI